MLNNVKIKRLGQLAILTHITYRTEILCLTAVAVVQINGERIVVKYENIYNKINADDDEDGCRHPAREKAKR